MGKKDNAIENYLLWFLNLLKVIFGTFFFKQNINCYKFSNIGTKQIL